MQYILFHIKIALTNNTTRCFIEINRLKKTCERRYFCKKICSKSASRRPECRRGRQAQGADPEGRHKQGKKTAGRQNAAVSWRA
jgi:hypothetical protein